MKTKKKFNITIFLGIFIIGFTALSIGLSLFFYFSIVENTKQDIMNNEDNNIEHFSINIKKQLVGGNKLFYFLLNSYLCFCIEEV